MGNLSRITKFGTLSIVLALITPLAWAQWGSAVLAPVSVGPENDQLCSSSLAIDNQGNLHLLYDRWQGGTHQFYYRKQPNGGVWSAPVQVGSGNLLLNPYLAVHKPSGTAYVVYLDGGFLKLAVQIGGIFTYYDLDTPYFNALFDPALAVDAAGNAHVAFIEETANVYKMCYGYWDGPVSNTFHLQILQNSQLGDFGSGAAPDLCVRSNGSVALSYRGGNYLSYHIDVAENASLGGTAWTIQTIEQPDYQCYSSSIKATYNNNLYLSYSGNMGWGFPTRTFFTQKPVGSPTWATSTQISGTFSGGEPKLAMLESGIAHIVFEEISGNIYTGNIIYATNLSSSWTAQNLLSGEKYKPSLVMDQFGNGNLVYQFYVGSQNYDVYYFGYVASYSPPDVNISITPVNPPIVIPPGGGSFSFNCLLANNTSNPYVVDVWINLTLPNGSIVHELYSGQDIYLGPSGTRTRMLTATIPGRAPVGIYTMIAYTGYFPTVISDSSSFQFVKTGSGDWGLGVGDWGITEQEYDGAGVGAHCVRPAGSGDDSQGVQLSEWTPSENAPTQPTSADLHVLVNPNPFNPTTTIRFSLPEALKVRLEVFDVGGQCVGAHGMRPADGGGALQGARSAPLQNIWYEAGTHIIPFDGSNLPSGVYIYRLTATPSGFGASPTMLCGKMILMK